MKDFLKHSLEYIGELVRVVLLSLAIILPVRYFLVQPFYVKGASMEPNFYDHEYLIIDEISYRFQDPSRGDIVVFRYPADPSQFFIKRVVGLPGETMVIKDGKVRIISVAYPDGRILEESYLSSDIFTYGEKKTTLGADEYFVLGDNRMSSLDSRHFGILSKSLIIGRVWLRGWPPERLARFLEPAYNL
ncbi:MAG: signal peptidase I [Patescibacteria group bacterium]